MKGKKHKLTKGNRSMIKELNRLWDFVHRFTLADNQPGVTETPKGLVLPTPRPSDGDTYVPPLSYSVITSGSNNYIEITEGWVNCPKDELDDALHEIQSWPLYPFMPTIGITALNATTAPQLELEDGDNYIHLEVTMTELVATIGDTELAGTYTGKVGTSVFVSGSESSVTVDNNASGTTQAIPSTEDGGIHDHANLDIGDGFGSVETDGTHKHTILAGTLAVHDHDVTDSKHEHAAVIQLGNVAYQVTTAPAFVLTTGSDFPTTLELVAKIPWGKFTVSADVVTVEEWYRHDHLDFFPANYVKAENSEGHGTSGDAAVNPRLVGPA